MLVVALVYDLRCSGSGWMRLPKKFVDDRSYQLGPPKSTLLYLLQSRYTVGVSLRQNGGSGPGTTNAIGTELDRRWGINLVCVEQDGWGTEKSGVLWCPDHPYNTV